VAEVSETLSHPDLGQLAWAPAPFHWSTEYRLTSGGRLDVFVEPYPSDRYAFLDRAAELFRWALDNEQRVFREALRADVLELYNDGWRQDGEPVLSEDEFAARLEWQLLKVKGSDAVPVEFWYDADWLFGGHAVVVQVGSGLQFQGAHLVG
jgi:hypothetical protein